MCDAVSDTDPAPIFLFGALRSGTTVFRLMLDAHPEISNPGEADFLFDYLQKNAKGNWVYDTDRLGRDRIFRAKKLTLERGLDGLELLEDLLMQLQHRAPGRLVLTVHRHLGRLVQALPNSRLIHLLRDPRDVARSSIGMGWAGNVFYGVDHWISTETGWDIIRDRIAVSNWTELKYEDLFKDLDAHLKHICAFIGVPYSEKMLSYHEGTTYGPPDPKLTEQWRHKATERDVALVERKAGPLMQSRGYAVSGPRLSLNPLERLFLFVSNKYGIWRFGVKRHGFSVFFMEKVTRWFGLERLNKGFRDTITRNNIQHLK